MNKIVDISKTILKTERLILRPWETTDLKDFYRYAKVDGVGEMAGWIHHKSKKESKEILNMFIEGKHTFAIVYKDIVIGSLGVQKYNTELFPEFDNLIGVEIGFVIGIDYWGMGIMPEACKEVIFYLFKEENLDFIIAGHYPRNTQSKRVQEKCGFKYYKTKTRKNKIGNIEETVYNIITKENYFKEIKE